jgi:hypothetical protein
VSQTDPASESWHTTLTDEIGLREREALAVTDAWPSEQALLDAYRDDATFTSEQGVGRRTSNRLYQYIDREHPDIVREHKRESEDYCTEFTTDHGLPAGDVDEDEFYFAAICPRCGEKNPHVGDPNDFKNRPYACVNCRWVPAYDGDSIEEFREANYPQADGDDEHSGDGTDGDDGAENVCENCQNEFGEGPDDCPWCSNARRDSEVDA